MKEYLALMREGRPDSPYTQFLMPEPVYTAAFNHVAMATCTAILTAYEIKNFGPEFFSDEDDGFELMSPLTPLNELFNPDRAPIVSDILSSFDLNSASVPKRVSPVLIGWLEQSGIELLDVDPRDDPFTILSQKQVREEERMMGIEPDEEDPREPLTIKHKRNYYMMPGVGQLLFTNSPLGELNDLLLKIEKTPMEQSAGLQGQLLHLSRAITGLNQREVLRSRVAAGEAYRAEEPGTGEMSKVAGGWKKR